MTRPKTWFLFLAAGLLLWASPANAGPWTTDGAPASTLTLTIYLTDSPVGGTGPLGVNGTVDADVAVDGGGDGTLTFNAADLVIDSIADVFVDLGFLGTLLFDLDAVGLNIDSTAIPVDAFVWDLDLIGAPTAMNLTLDQGMIVIHDPTGPVGGAIDDPTILDLDASPVGVGIDDLLGLGINGTASMLAISINIPEILIDVGEEAIGPDVLFAGLEGMIFLVPVPEPSSFAICGIGLVGLVGLARRRFRKA